MTDFRFLHTSDLHLGKPFGKFPEETRADLHQARQTVIERLAACATENEACHILVAGDTFDIEAPSDRLMRQAITAMGANSAINWWIIAGNHDSLRAELIWQTFAAHAPDNVHVLTECEPVEIEKGVSLLPAPCPRRFPGVDLTEWMNDCDTPDGNMRIGLAHGGVIDFRPSEPSGETISPNRATDARLDYLALGDWHGELTFNQRTRYSGAPERDRFKHEGRGVCLLVTIFASHAEPDVSEYVIGEYNWQRPELRITPEMDAVAAFKALLPVDHTLWRKTLVKLHTSGHINLPERMRLTAEVKTMKPEFCHFEWNEYQLQTEYNPDDLDEIARSGALRMAGDALKAGADNDDLARHDRDVASAALTRLYSLVKETAQ